MAKLKEGWEYEAKAREYLKKNGYLVIAANVTYKFGEIDIVAEQGEVLVFIEVRKRDKKHWIAPEESITYVKERRLRLAIQAYLAKYRGRATKVRTDLMGFTVDQNGNEVLKHFEGFI